MAMRMSGRGAALSVGLLLWGAALAAEPSLEEEMAREVERLASPEQGVRARAFDRLFELGLSDPRRFLSLLPQEPDDPEVDAQCAILRYKVPWEAGRREALAAAADSPKLREAVDAVFDAPGPLSFKGLLGFGKKRNPALAAALRVLLEQGDALTRQYAARAIGQLGDASSALLLEPLLSAREPDLRMIAVRALGRLEAKGSAAKVEALLADPDDRVRLGALETLFKLGSPAAGAKAAALLEDPGFPHRPQVAQYAGTHRVREAVEPLLRLLGDPDARVRGAAAEALCAIGDPRMGPAALKLLAREELPARLMALRMLMRTGDPAHVEAIAGRLSDPEELVRTNACHVLGILRSRAAIPHLAALLDGKDDMLAQQAAAAIGRIVEGEAPKAWLPDRARKWWAEHKDDPEFKTSKE